VLVTRTVGTVIHLRTAPTSIETLPSESLWVKVYAGYDPVSGKRHYLYEVVPAGRRAAVEAAVKVTTRLLHEVDGRRNHKARATVNQLLDRYLAVVDLESPRARPTSATSTSMCDRCSVRCR